jgi:hypothetical protein
VDAPVEEVVDDEAAQVPGDGGDDDGHGVRFLFW